MIFFIIPVSNEDSGKSSKTEIPFCELYYDVKFLLSNNLILFFKILIILKNHIILHFPDGYNGYHV